MDYKINYGFLSDFLAANPGMEKKDILHALNSEDYGTFNRWFNGDKSLPLEHLCRICNYFGLDISGAFFDGEAMPRVRPQAPDINSQTQPNGGYPEGKKKRGEHGINPHTEIHEVGKMPEKWRMRIFEPENGESSVESGESREESGESREESVENKDAMLRLQLAYQREINEVRTNAQRREDAIRKEMQEQIEKERERLLKIIADQNKNLADLSRELYMNKHVKNTERDSAAFVHDDVI